MRTDTRIVIVGAGYAGLWAARALSRRRGVRVTVINDRDHFVERVRLHQSATGQTLSRVSLAEVFAGTGIELIIDEMTALRPAEQTIELRSRTVGYDRLIYAIGSRAVPAPGEAEQLAVPDGADRLRDRLSDVRSGTVAVIGGGLTGLETAAEIAVQRPACSVRLITATPVDAELTPAAGRYLRSVFDRLGVRLDEGLQVTATTPTSVTCVTEAAEASITLDADLVVWTTGFEAHPYARDAGLAVDELGRIRVDGQLRSVSDRRIYAIGDSAAVPMGSGEPARMCCQIAVPMGFRAGREVVRSSAGRRRRPHRPRFVWRTISLGRTRGLVQFTGPDDRPLPIFLRGRAAAGFKELVCILVAWLTTGRRPSRSQLESGGEQARVPASSSGLRHSAA